MGKLLKKIFLSVCSKNYLHRRKPIQSQFYFRHDRFQCCYFPFLFLKVLFSSGYLLNSPQKNTDSHFPNWASAIELCDFFHGNCYSALTGISKHRSCVSLRDAAPTRQRFLPSSLLLNHSTTCQIHAPRRQY